MTAVAETGTFAVRDGGSRPLAGTGALLRLALRRDRVMLPLWVLITGGVITSAPNSLRTLYATAADRTELVHTMATNGSLRALYGPAFGDSVGALVAWRYVTFGALLTGIMSLIIVIRHTREEEETGRQELLSSAMVGRRAPLTAALLTAFVANAGVALVIAAGLAGEGAGGALALGLVIGGAGMLFATMAGIVAQLTESARLAKGLTAAVLGAAFVMRAAGDAGTDDGSSVLTWLSPIGWAENMRSFAGERWWVLLLFAGAIAVQCAVAFNLAGRRDIGMSFLPTRPGPASGRLATVGGLAWRLQRGSVLGWGVGLLATGVMFGAITEGATELVGDSERTRQIIERMGGQQGLTDAFLAGMVGMIGMVTALYVVQSVLRLHGEETGQRAEPLLAAAVGRVQWAAGHLAIAFGGAVLMMLLGGAGLAIGYGRDLGPILGASLVQLPAIWVLGGVAVLLHGAFPKAVAAAWAAAGISLGLGWIGPALDLPDAVMNLSPYAHLPKLPGPEMAWTPVLLLTAIAVALVAAGLAGFRRRDLSA
ncbi:ABC transporter permease [Streptomyces formicae]|uniref:ABC transporter permease n=1 Tax=Streptomyces formicae TaxID=1616117 RepID=A0ABY3WCT7_9ACTN|nr:ABC transporter permease [Streptomyces formicae]UNM10354.1 ABC transporter permease [Streptomyces formicae]